MDGQCLSLNSIAAQVCHRENGREAVPTSPNQSSSRMGTAKYQGCGRWCQFLKRSFPSYVGGIEIKLRWPSKLLFLLSADVRLGPAAEGKIRFPKRNRKRNSNPPRKIIEVWSSRQKKLILVGDERCLQRGVRYQSGWLLMYLCTCTQSCF